jgi:tetratricopeptide (TPR) repeat protein
MPESAGKADLMTKMAAEMSDSRPAEAAELCREALAISDRLGYDGGKAYGLGILSFCEIVLARHQEALRHGLESLGLLRKLGEEARACRMENQIACIHRHLGDYRMAKESYRRVEEAARRSGDRLLEASALNNLGIVHQHMGDNKSALDFFRQGLEKYREIGEQRFAAGAMVNLADLYRESGDYEPALANSLGAAKIMMEYGDKAGAASAHHVAGNTYRDMGDPVQAVDQWEKCIKMSREVGSLETEVSALTSTAVLMLADRKAEEALEVLDMAASQAWGLGDRKILIAIHTAYAEAWRQLGDEGRAEEYALRARNIDGSIGSPREDS